MADDGAILYPPASNSLMKTEVGWYDDSGRPMLATQSGKGWSTTGLEKTGGFGIAMAIDTKGNAYVSYLDRDGFVTVATVSGGKTSVEAANRISVSNARTDLAGGTASFHFLLRFKTPRIETVAWMSLVAALLLVRAVRLRMVQSR